MTEESIASIQKFPKISTETAEAYAHAADKLLNHVYEQLVTNPKITELTGQNPLEMVRNNLQNHALFMTSVMRLNSYELLTQTVYWMYRAYRAKGFLYDYFPVEHVAWQIALHACLENSTYKTEILAVYIWLVQHHTDIIHLARAEKTDTFSVQSEVNETQPIFLSLLLLGNSHGCLKLAEQSITTADDLKYFYLNVIWPAMHKIGQLWESNQISVAEEHLATAIVGRVMAALYPRVALFNVTKGKAIVSAGPNEFHEVGARMVADFMEMDGWDVTYLGANIPAQELANILKRDKPFVIALSVSTVFNLESVWKTIQMIHEDHETREMKILIGGTVFNEIPQLWHIIGADGYAADAESALRELDTWWITERSDHA